MAVSPKGSRTAQLWTKSPFTNLVRYEPSGTYFARIRVDVRLIRKSLDTTVLSVAKLRLGDFEKSERQARENQSTATARKMTFATAMDMFRTRLHGDVSLKPKTRSYYEQRLTALLKSWSDLPNQDVRSITKTRFACDCR